MLFVDKPAKSTPMRFHFEIRFNTVGVVSWIQDIAAGMHV